MNERDQLFSQGVGVQGSFVFDERVVRVFPNMIARSVPGYELVVPLTGMLARRYAQEHSVLYDLGCSLGASTLAMRTAVRGREIRIVAIDSSSAMVDQCQKVFDAQEDGIPVQVLKQDISDADISDASVVVMNYTLQFVAPEERSPLLSRIWHGLKPGGVLILSEKFKPQCPSDDHVLTQWHHDFKRAQGYSELEIAAKRSALEDVLRPDAMEVLEDRLSDAGFEHVDRWFQCFNFCSYLARK